MNKMDEVGNNRPGSNTAATAANGDGPCGKSGLGPKSEMATAGGGGGGPGSGLAQCNRSNMNRACEPVGGKVPRQQQPPQRNQFQNMDFLPKTPQKQRFHELYVQRHNNVR